MMEDGPFYMYHPESDSIWVVDTVEERDLSLEDGLVQEISKEQFDEIKKELQQ